MNTHDIAIRALTLDDAAFLPEIVYHAIHVAPGAQPPPHSIVNEPDVARYVCGWGRSGDYGALAYDAKTHDRAGAAWLRLFTAADPAYGFVAEDIPEISIALFPGYRNRGVGTRLIEDLVAHATPLYPALSLAVVDTNPAIRLYQRIGFTPVAIDGHSITMRLDLR